MELYPGWTARDNYAKHKKKRRNRRDKVRAGTHDEGTTIDTTTTTVSDDVLMVVVNASAIPPVRQQWRRCGMAKNVLCLLHTLLSFAVVSYFTCDVSAVLVTVPTLY